MLPVSNVANDQLGLGSGIVNRTIKPGSGDWVGIGAGRLASLKRANNITRDAFMKAVADMFGGVGSIPDNVKEAMKLEDYGKGKPLTARRRGALQDPGFAGCRVCGTRHRRRAAGRRLANRPRRKAGAALRGGQDAVSFALRAAGGEARQKGNAHPRPCARRLGPWAFT